MFLWTMPRMDEKAVSVENPPVRAGTREPSWNNGLDYRALFDQAGDCIFVISPDLTVLAVNPQAGRLLGYDEGELAGQSAAALLGLDKSAWVRLIFEQPTRRPFERSLRRKDGSFIQAEMSSSAVLDSAGAPVCVQLIARDVSERRQNERILKRNMRAQSIIGEVTAMLFRSTNIEGRMPESLELLGYAVGVFSCVIFEAKNSTLRIRHKWVDPAVPEFDAEAVLNPFLDSLARFPDRVFTIPDAPENASSVPGISVLAVPIQGALGMWGFLGLFSGEDRQTWLPTSFEIVQTTANLLGAAIERTHYEETLRLSERRNRIIVDALPDLLLRVDRSGRIFDYNASPVHPLFLEAAVVIGRNLIDLWGDEVAGKLLPRIPNETLFTQPRMVDSFCLPGRDGVFEARLFPLSKLEALILVRDITEQARLDQMKSDFINWASHELRTPITSAILMTDLLRKGCTPEESEEYLATLSSELNRQKNLINELLMAGRLEHGALRVEMAPLDLLPVLKESVSGVKPIAKMRNINIRFMPQPQPCVIWGDRSALHQVFINLLSNAVKFSPDGGDVEIGLEQTGKEARVSISDSGLGIPPDALPHLFERFYRARNVTAADIPGSGIGLYIVKSIVGELRGGIHVDTEVNKGTKFTVTLNLVETI
jgi:PAS domain S-box-containing protein